MSVSGIHGHLLEVTVVGCSRLKDTEWLSRQDPYVCLEYGSTKYKTTTHTDGGTTPNFQEKFVLTLIEGLREINVLVWNSNTLKSDNLIGTGKVQLQKVLSQGFDDNSWTLQSNTGRYAGELRLIMHYANASKLVTNYGASAPPYRSPPQTFLYGAPPPASAYLSASTYPPSAYPSLLAYPPVSAYPLASSYPSSYPNLLAYPPNPSTYLPSAYLLAPQPTAYPPQPYPPAAAYPPQPCPPPQVSTYYPPPGPYSRLYPSPPY